MNKAATALLALVFVVGTAFAAGAQTSNQGTTTTGNQNTPGTTTAPGTQTGTVQKGNLDKKDMKFLQDTAMDNPFEIQASQLAAQKANSQEVKDFAQKLVTDHTRLSSELSSLASTKGVNLSSSMEKKDRKELDELNKHSGKKFDHEYVKEMVKNHKEDIRDFKAEAKDAKDPDVKNWASNHVSALEQHLTMAQDLEKKVK